MEDIKKMTLEVIKEHIDDCDTTIFNINMKDKLTQDDYDRLEQLQFIKSALQKRVKELEK